MAKIPFLSKNFKADLLKLYTPEVLQLGDIVFTAELLVDDKIFKDIRYDATFIQKCHDRIKKGKILDKFFDGAARMLIVQDAIAQGEMIFGNKAEAQRCQKTFKDEVAKLGKGLEQEVQAAVQEQYTKRQKVLQDYTKSRSWRPTPTRNTRRSSPRTWTPSKRASRRSASWKSSIKN